MLTELEALFSSMARIKILRLLLLDPGSQFYQREIERETEQPIRAVQREVERLEGIGLLLRSKQGNRVFYGLNPEFPLLAELSALFHKAFGAEPKAAEEESTLPPEPSTIPQPFPWMETCSTPALPADLRKVQVKGEWDRGY
jgi:hypothetical protein